MAIKNRFFRLFLLGLAGALVGLAVNYAIGMLDRSLAVRLMSIGLPAGIGLAIGWGFAVRTRPASILALALGIGVSSTGAQGAAFLIELILDAYRIPALFFGPSLWTPQILWLAGATVVFERLSREVQPAPGQSPLMLPQRRWPRFFLLLIVAAALGDFGGDLVNVALHRRVTSGVFSLRIHATLLITATGIAAGLGWAAVLQTRRALILGPAVAISAMLLFRLGIYLAVMSTGLGRYWIFTPNQMLLLSYLAATLLFERLTREPIAYACECGKIVRLRPALAGKLVECLSCKRRGRVPVPGAEKQEAAEAAAVAPAQAAPATGGLKLGLTYEPDASLETLGSFGETVKRAFALYKKIWLTLFLISFATIGMILVMAGILGGSAWYLTGAAPQLSTKIFPLTGALVTLTTLYLISWGHAAMVTAVVFGEDLNTAFARSQKWIGAFFGGWVLATILIVLGHFALIIPGLMFILWTFFFPFAIVLDGAGAAASMGVSRSYTKGRFWATAVRLLAFWILCGAVSAIPVAGQIAALFVPGFMMAFSFILCQELRVLRAKGSPPKGGVGFMLAIALLGLLVAGAGGLFLLREIKRSPQLIMNAMLGAKQFSSRGFSGEKRRPSTRRARPRPRPAAARTGRSSPARTRSLSGFRPGPVRNDLIDETIGKPGTPTPIRFSDPRCSIRNRRTFCRVKVESDVPYPKFHYEVKKRNPLDSVVDDSGEAVVSGDGLRNIFMTGNAYKQTHTVSLPGIPAGSAQTIRMTGKLQLTLPAVYVSENVKDIPLESGRTIDARGVAMRIEDVERSASTTSFRVTFPTVLGFRSKMIRNFHVMDSNRRYLRYGQRERVSEANGGGMRDSYQYVILGKIETVTLWYAVWDEVIETELPVEWNAVIER